MAFLPPLLTFSSWIRLDCIARTRLGLYTLHLEVEWLWSWIHWLQMGDVPLLWVAWSYTDTTNGQTVLRVFWSYDSPNILDLLQNPIEQVEDTRSMVNYLDMSGGSAVGLFFYVFRVFSWFLDEGKWFIHDWCVIHMGGQRAGWAGRWTPGRCGTLWVVKHSWCRCCSLGRFTAASAQHPLSPETVIHQKMSHCFDRICIELIIFFSIELLLETHKKNKNSFTNLSSSVRPLSWLRLRLTGYTVGTRTRSFVICLYLSSLLRWGWPNKQKGRITIRCFQKIQSYHRCFDYGLFAKTNNPVKPLTTY